MAIAFRSAGALAGVASGNITCAAPAGIVNDDILIAIFIADDAVAISLAGWTSIQSIDNAGAALRTQALYKRAASESGNYVFTHTGGSTTNGRVFAFSGCKTSGSAINTSSSKGSSPAGTSITNNSITPTVNGCQILELVTIDGDTVTTASYAGGSLTWTEHFDSGDSVTAFKSIALASAPQATASAISPTATISTSTNWNSVVVALEPATVATTISGITLSKAPPGRAPGNQPPPYAFKAGAPLASGNAYLLTAQAGSYTYAGQSAILLRSKLLTASAGSYIYTGQSATLVKGRVLTASAGSYTYAGQSADLFRSKLLTAFAGSYAYTGQTASLLHSRLITASAGIYAYSGQNATLTYMPVGSYVLTAQAGAYTYAGQTATLLKSKAVVAQAGTYAYSGQAANIAYASAAAYVLTAQAGAYVYAGQGINFSRSGGQNSGGGFYDEFERHYRQRQQRLKELEEAEESENEIQSALDAQIAQLLHEQERKDQERQDRERLLSLAQQAQRIYSDLSERTASALLAAQEKQTLAALEAFERELNRQLEEEQFAVLMLLALD